MQSDDLDLKLTNEFAGRVVRKDLVRKIKVGANVPVFVLEYLLGKYCATDDQNAIEAGLRVVNNTLADNFIRSDEANKAQALVKEKERHTFIDKVDVRYLAEEDKYWAHAQNFGSKFIHVPDRFVRDHERLLTSGVWAEIEIRHQYDEEQKGKRSPFWLERITPVQLATFNLDTYRQGRAAFNTDEWIDILIRSIGMEPSHFSRRLKLLLLIRLIPLCESNYNLVELGPRGTGKSYGFQELSPYANLLTGTTTVANMFYNLSTGKIGIVGLWDAVAFDEVADLEKMPKEVVTTLKTYCESGTFSRKATVTGRASIALLGNTNQPVETMVRSSHLFVALPEVIREDMAFLDRIHYYIPGWEVPKMRNEYFTDHYGFVVDYLAEALRELRRHTFTDVCDKYFSFGPHLNARDVKAVRKTVSGLIKLIYPHGEFTKTELAELLEIAIEGRRRVKEQLKKMGSFEYHQTSFSYRDSETTEEVYVGVPEEGGRALIATDPLAPGSVYAASVNDDGKVGLYRIEVGTAAGTGKLKHAGGSNSSMKETINRAFGFLQGSKVSLGIASAFDTTDFHVETIDLLTNRISCDAGIAVVVAIISALKKIPVQPGMVILGDLSIQGNIKPVTSLAEPLQVAMENGAKRALIPLGNKRNFLEVSGEIAEKVDPIFFSDAQSAGAKALGMV
jgi:ATP-dependent Lon protease